MEGLSGNTGQSASTGEREASSRGHGRPRAGECWLATEDSPAQLGAPASTRPSDSLRLYISTRGWGTYDLNTGLVLTT